MTDRSDAHAAEADRIKAANLGHGHVYERADGLRGSINVGGVAQDCGGPERCTACRNDWLHRYGAPYPATSPVPAPTASTEEETG